MPSPPGPVIDIPHHNNLPFSPAHNNDDRPHSSTPAQHPPPRPSIRSNFELEPNPFEQSFSVSSSSLSSLRQSINHKNVPSPPSASKSPPSASLRDSSPSRKHSLNNAGANPNGDTPKPTLPPLASITSPSDPTYSWAFSSAGITNSLRAGPLSPAMLAGPQQQPTTTTQPAASIAALAASAGSMHPPLFSFDPSGSYRTGLTPSTGLTPLVGGPVAFPPPSPNTAAFLAMVNSGTNTTITPNTLNAIAGVLGQSPSMTNQPSQQQQQQQANGVNGNNSNSNGTNNANVSSSPTQSQGVVPSSVAPSQVAAPASTTYQNGSLNSQSRSDRNNNGSSNGYSDATGAANHAANGLFLLSQAHQELTKREEAQKQSLAQGNGAAKGSSGSAAQIQAAQSKTNGVSSAKRGAKRKVETASISSGTSAKGGSAKKAKSTTSSRGSAARRGSTVSNQEGDEGEGEDDDSDDDEQQLAPPQSGNNKNRKPETEEEKRRNFLERNRQAALKCRQRKKQWLAQLQAKNEFLQNENERLTAALVASREEISRLSQLVGGAGVGLASGVVPMVGVAGMGVQHQQVHHAPYMAHQQQQHPIAVPVSLPQGSSSVAATAASPPMVTKASPHLQHHHSQQQVHRSPNPHSPTSDGRSSRSSFRDYANGATVNGRENGTREYARDLREREMGHGHGHAPQAVVVNGRGYGY